jgi:leucyl aminopeptidase (aminopeptidase T)
MDIDPTKAPRTHATWKKAYNVRELAKLMVELSVQLEVELNVATVNEVFAENKVHILEKELEKANNRIKRLEEGGDEAICALEYASRVRIWTEAKESKP